MNIHKLLYSFILFSVSLQCLKIFPFSPPRPLPSHLIPHYPKSYSLFQTLTLSPRPLLPKTSGFVCPSCPQVCRFFLSPGHSLTHPTNTFWLCPLCQALCWTLVWKWMTMASTLKELLSQGRQWGEGTWSSKTIWRLGQGALGLRGRGLPGDHAEIFSGEVAFNRWANCDIFLQWTIIQQ